MRFDFVLAVNLAQLANSAAGSQQPLHYTPSTSQFRTANYITHGLPQQCLPSPRSPTVPRISASENGSVNVSLPPETLGGVVVTVTEIREVLPVINSQSHPQETYSKQVETVKDASLPVEDNDSPLDNANFLSFEEWRKQLLAKAGQSSEDLGERAPREPRRRPGTGSINDLDSLGDDAEIELSFGFGDHEAPESTQQKPTEQPPEQSSPVWGQRSKMAGKTGKERFNYASFDCAATVHKTNREVKGSSAILVENKDSYMLNECRAENKFVIVELCDDILVDTVVLANYEFFSSMFKTFRVSVSDRYPVKASGWKELGVFEGKNSREIQAFLVENPQIWARYVKIDFLTHYGNEFYCPISLLRIHGTTMLEEFRAQEEAVRGVVTEDFLDDEVTGSIPAEPKKGDEGASIQPDVLDISTEGELTKVPTVHDKFSAQDIPSGAWDIAVVHASLVTDTPGPEATGLAQCRVTETAALILVPCICSAEYKPSPTVQSSSRTASDDTNSSTELEPLTTPTTPPKQESTPTRKSLPDSSAPGAHSPSDALSHSLSVKKTTETYPSPAQDPPPRVYSSPITPPLASPTQESFYKQIHKRIQFLEANVTLSLQYIEDQSRTLRDAMAKVEKRQAQKQATFMETLNATMQEQLSEYRQQYDQLWQSTVIALENQRRQYESEILAVSSRLALLADEVIYQKRMAYVQMVLLLVCVGVVLFSKSSHFDAPLIQSFRDRNNTTLRSFESPPTSPQVLNSSSPREVDIDDTEDGDLTINGGRMRKWKRGIFSTFTRRKPVRQDSVDSIDCSSLRSPTFATAFLSPGFEPSRERAQSPPSPRPPSPIIRSSPATPTGTRGRQGDGTGEDEWKVFGPNSRVAELKAAHAGSAKQSFQKLPSPLGIYTGEQQDENDAGAAMYDETEDKDRDEEELNHRRRKSESAILRVGRKVGVGGLPSPSMSPSGSPRQRPSTAMGGSSQSQSSQGQPGSQSQSKGHSRANSKHHKKKGKK
ncbi:UNC-like C-terminal-domain-containing protein [Tirmania nivea]|nr:UNC-like C-terminal-domain-containing protein [Tirmania nivea]